MKRAIFIALLALASCGKSAKDDKATGSATPPAGSGSATMAGSGSATAAGSGSAMAGSGSAAPVDVPTEMDFEDQAKAKITDKNVEAQAKALEADLGK